MGADPRVGCLLFRSTVTSRLRLRSCTSRRNARPATFASSDDTSASAPSLAPGRIGQAASFDGKNFVQFGGDVAGFDSYGAGRGAIGANDPTVTYDDGYTMAAWIYPTGPDGAIVTRDEDVVEPNGHGLNLRDGRDRIRLRDQVGR